MLLSFSSTMTSFVAGNDAVSGATPLALMAADTELPSLVDMFLGKHAGSLGETCTVALLIGGIYLIVRRVITWHTPVVYIATVFIFTLILGEDPVYQILSGGLMLGAIFMATDYSTTPPTKWGKVIFGFGCGIITVLIRVFGNYPEGVSFAILFMNILTPYISIWTREDRSEVQKENEKRHPEKYYSSDLDMSCHSRCDGSYKQRYGSGY